MKNILYTKNFNQNIDENVNVILSPEFYWIKKIDIPIKSLKEAKKIAQNIFDLEDHYKFDAIKIKDNFFALAIDKNLKLNIPKKYISSIRIAQTELYDFDVINLDNKHLEKIDDILFLLPSNKNGKNLEDILTNLKLSSYKINDLNLDKTSIIVIFSILIISMFALIINIISYKSTYNQLTQKQDNLKKYNLPLTNIQLDSILDNLKNKEYNIILLKKDLEFFSKTPLKGKFISLEKDNNSYKVEIKTTKNLNNYFKQRFNIKSFSFESNIYKAELSHE